MLSRSWCTHFFHISSRWVRVALFFRRGREGGQGRAFVIEQKQAKSSIIIIINVFLLMAWYSERSKLQCRLVLEAIAWDVHDDFQWIKRKLKTSFLVSAKWRREWSERHQPDDHLITWCSIIRNFPFPFGAALRLVILSFALVWLNAIRIFLSQCCF